MTPFFENMILLEIDIRNPNCVFTLKEKTTIDAAYYLFEVWSTQNPESKQYFLAPELSEYPDSYNMFSLKAISTGTPDQDAGEFLCKQSDFWNYKVYEQASDSNLDPDGLDAVETGIIRVNRTRESAVEFTQTNTIINYGN